MNKQTLVKLAQEIAAHAVNPPRQPGEKKMRVNPLSPHFERFVCETVRGYLIKQTQQSEAQIASQLASFRAFLPESLRAQFEHTCNIINNCLHDIYK